LAQVGQAARRIAEVDVTWWIWALASALAASATAILAKVGVSGVPSNLAMAIRTSVVLLFAWGFTFASREHHMLASIQPRSALFLVLSGIATGASWLAYFKALQLAPASRVAPIDKLSLGLTILLAALILGEPLTWKLALGATLMVVGALITLA
jgi:bacterial/archaeal transporter family protein